MLSRVADSLYWMSRYVERAENTARVLDVAWRMSLLVKEPGEQDREWFAPLNITGTLFPFSGRHSLVCAREVLHFMALDPENPSSIYACARQAPRRLLKNSLKLDQVQPRDATDGGNSRIGETVDGDAHLSSSARAGRAAPARCRRSC